MKATETPEPITTREPSRNTAISHGGEIIGYEKLPAVLGETLWQTVQQHPDKKLIHIAADGSETAHTYAELLEEAYRCLAGFQDLGLQPGDKILFQCDFSRDFIPAFWGATLGGFVPVPVSVASDFTQENAAVLKLRNAWGLLGQPLILTSAKLHESILSLKRFPEMKALRAAICEDLRATTPRETVHPANTEDLALMMLTSGSTGVPKGVMLSHRNLVARSAGSVQMNRFSSDDISLSWMPLDHVASLIYFHLRDVFTGATQVHVSPGFILQNPLRWLDLLHRFRASVTFAPNFAFGLVNERAKEMKRRQWDLSAIRYFLNGGEAVVPRTARQFMQLICRHGVRPDAMRPAWGMSEISSGVTYGDRFRLDLTRDCDQFTEVGLPIPGTSLRIVNEHDEPVREGEIGRLQFKGFTLMSGYYNNPSANQEAFTVDGWFKTGDLGMLRDARLTITGREKDIIIINGVNYYSHEIESVTEQIPGVEISFAAACAVRTAAHPEERLAIFFSATEWGKEHMAELMPRIRASVAQQNGIKPEYLVPLPKEEIPKTEIGKIQRPKLKARFEAGEFENILKTVDELFAQHHQELAPRTETERKLAHIWQEVVGSTNISRDDTFFAVGGASLAANRVISRVREQFNIELPLRVLFDPNGTLEKVACYITGQSPSSLSVIPPVSRETPLPLSPAQRRIWITEQVQPGTTQFNVARALWLRGALDQRALHTALESIIQRHEILRTVFDFKNGEPVQVIRPEVPLDLPCVDLQSEPDAEQSAIRMAGESLSEPFDLAQGPLIRAKLFQVGPEEFLLSLCFHQIVVDGGSIGILFDELATFYTACTTAASPGLHLLPVQYADYATWQSKEGARKQEDFVYWKKRLEGAVPRMDWIPEKAVSSKACTERLILNKSVTAKIRSFNQQENTTLFMTLLSAYLAVLRRKSSRDEISIGTAISGRNRTAIEKLIGFFVNTVILRNHIAPDKTFRALLQEVRSSAIDAMAHSDVPFEELVASLNNGRARSGNPFFHVWFSFMDSMADFNLGPLAASPIHVPPTEAQFDLSLFIVERPEEIDCFFEYKTELLDQQTIREFMNTYATLLDRAIECPDLTLDILLTPPLAATVPAQKHSVENIHSWIEEEARRNPNAPAVTCGGATITYEELNRRANQLARYLVARGAGANKFIGIALPRSIETVISILAVLKAGAAYAPLDPAYPAERIEQMLGEITPPVVLTNSEIRKSLPDISGTILALDSEWNRIAQEQDTNLNTDVAPDQFAYVIFTSGSTGKPKGVAITHANLAFSTRSRLAYYEEPIRSYLMISSFSFDSSVAGIFWTLCTGAHLVLPTNGAHQDPQELLKLIHEHKVSHFLGLPSLYNLMLHETNPTGINTLKVVIVAGESCSRELIERHCRTLPHARLYNEYGPTEATVWCTVARLRLEDRVTIGKAIPGAQVYILDEQMKPARPGESGEIFVGGPGVAGGYLNRPEATAQKFVPDCFSNDPNALLYRTGDLARLLPGGNIEFLGRMDHQVKIRGFRIELEEIESALRGYAGIRSVVVNAYQPTDSLEKVIVAYIVATQELSTRELRDHLKQHLPDYMIPGVLMFMESLPLMPNGKVDRSALPAPTQEQQTSETFVAPRTPCEEEIASIWRELLRREQVSVHDNFFELGGHSLLGIQVMARIRQQFQIEMPLKHIFEAPTVAELAERVFEHLIQSEENPAGQVEQENRTTTV